MNKHNVEKPNTQVNMFLNPELLTEGFDLDYLLQELQIEMHALATSAGAALVSLIVNAEVEQMVGNRYSRTGTCYPWGEQSGYCIVGGQKVPLVYTRVRTGPRKGKEVPIKSYKRFQQDDERKRRVFAESMSHVSCRQYKKAIETVERGYGISKSVVSRDLVKATTTQLDMLLHRSLEDVDIMVLVIDGIEIGGSVFICALGVDRKGRKHVLGFLEGATENAAVCMRLLEDIRERGLRLNRPLLSILDGAKALSKAVRHVCGETVQIQRCHEHKIRNVKDHLPKSYHLAIERKIRVAYKMNNYTEAKAALHGVVRELERINEAAARSLEEGMEETLTVHRLTLPDILRRSFSTTNMIESMYSRCRDIMRNVKRWTTDNQKARWVAASLLQTEQSFRSVKGFRSMEIFATALETFVYETVNRKNAA